MKSLTSELRSGSVAFGLPNAMLDRTENIFTYMLSCWIISRVNASLSVLNFLIEIFSNLWENSLYIILGDQLVHDTNTAL